MTLIQIKALLGLEPRTFNQWRVYVVVATVLDTGCLVDEVIKLSVADVDMENLLLAVYDKGNEERKIPFSLELRKVLFRYRQFKNRHGVDSELLFHRLRVPNISSGSPLQS